MAERQSAGNQRTAQELSTPERFTTDEMCEFAGNGNSFSPPENLCPPAASGAIGKKNPGLSPALPGSAWERPGRMLNYFSSSAVHG